MTDEARKPEGLPTRWAEDWPHGDLPYARSAEDIAGSVDDAIRDVFAHARRTGRLAYVTMVGRSADPEHDFAILASDLIERAPFRPFLDAPDPRGMRLLKLTPIHRLALLRAARSCATFGAPFGFYVGFDVILELRPDGSLWSLVITCRIPDKRVWRCRAPSTIDSLLRIFDAWAECISTGRKMPPGLGLLS